MSTTFTITNSSSEIDLGEGRQGSITITVKNISGRRLTGRVSLVTVPAGQDFQTWLQLSGIPEQDYAIDQPRDYQVNITAPATAEKAGYQFQLNAVDVELPDETFTQGSPVTIMTPEPYHPPVRLQVPRWLSIMFLIIGILDVIFGLFLVWAFVKVLIVSNTQGGTINDVIGQIFNIIFLILCICSGSQVLLTLSGGMNLWMFFKLRKLRVETVK